MRRNSDLELLHPTCRGKVEALRGSLAAEDLAFQPFEAYRSPQRQAMLFAQGRTQPGPIVTKARPWSSFHQYGLACDFVLFLDGRWSWDDSGERARWWARLHELARAVGLVPLSWERPHVQMEGVSLDELRAGRYPPGGNRAWAENLAQEIMTWNDSPPAPPLPPVPTERPPLDPSDVPEEDLSEVPGPASEGWHNRFDGQEWRYDPQGVYVRDHEEGQRPLRTSGEPTTARAILDTCGEAVVAAARKYQVPLPLIMMVIATETSFARRAGFTGPSTFRWEPHVKVRDVSPQIMGDYSAGPMQTLATTARWVIREQKLDYFAYLVAPPYERQPESPVAHPLYDYRANVDIGTAEIKQRWDVTGADPILVSAVFNAGSLRSFRQNPWHLKSTGDHLDRAAKWYGDACAVLAERSLPG